MLFKKLYAIFYIKISFSSFLSFLIKEFWLFRKEKLNFTNFTIYLLTLLISINITSNRIDARDFKRDLKQTI